VKRRSRFWAFRATRTEEHRGNVQEKWRNSGQKRGGVVHVRGVWWDPVIVGESGEVRRLVGKKTNASYNKVLVLSSGHRTVVVDALAQVLICRVVSEPSEFVLNGLGKVRVLDD